MGVFNRAGTFHGGLFLPPSPASLSREPVRSLAAPSVLNVPLAQGSQDPSRPVVREGQVVTAGDLLGEASNGAGRVHSPVNGSVEQVVAVDTPYNKRVPAVRIARAGDGVDELASSGAERNASDRPSPRNLLARARELGIDLPDADALAARETVDRIIVAGVETEPYHTAQVRTLMDHAGETIRSASLMHEVFGARRTHLVVDSDRAALVASLRQAAHRTPVRVDGVPPRYPQSATQLLAGTVGGREVPYGKKPLDVGVWVTDVCTVLDLGRAVTRHQALTWTTITAAGDALLTPGTYRIPLGVTIRDVVDQIGLRNTPRQIVVGNVLNGTGVATADTVLPKATRCVTVWRQIRRPPREPQACIRCGVCQEVCPVGLDPRALLDLADRRRFDCAASRRPHACVDCGLCDYVCPSWLPLTRGVRLCRTHVPLG
jgi:electron transport complex protein RnfC